jgi:hypothetical protein
MILPQTSRSGPRFLGRFSQGRLTSRDFFGRLSRRLSSRLSRGSSSHRKSFRVAAACCTDVGNKECAIVDHSLNFIDASLLKRGARNRGWFSWNWQKEVRLRDTLSDSTDSASTRWNHRTSSIGSSNKRNEDGNTVQHDDQSAFCVGHR